MTCSMLAESFGSDKNPPAGAGRFVRSFDSVNRLWSRTVEELLSSGVIRRTLLPRSALFLAVPRESKFLRPSQPSTGAYPLDLNGLESSPVAKKRLPSVSKSR